MATISGSTPTSSITHVGLAHRRPLERSSRVGLPAMARGGRVRCCMESKSLKADVGMGASLLAAVCAATVSSPAVALVDERMSTEGTGLPFGLSNNLLGWILLGVFGLIWAFYTVYTSELDEDEESGMSL
ncbi:photosystem II reaction center W protein, chloroplastic isoform X2 [Neltuma alba]|uniref:photosystem II reaction center W protein, chloroplastic isoform X2 n=1 Tax=Neltuma alba TaxID=207710 RepID=UPI0010A30F4B|nr:photosystem II reaction center W protein, chloroplastic-like isoform X2 [Prosopis alba]